MLWSAVSHCCVPTSTQTHNKRRLSYLVVRLSLFARRTGRHLGEALGLCQRSARSFLLTLVFRSARADGADCVCQPPPDGRRLQADLSLVSGAPCSACRLTCCYTTLVAPDHNSVPLQRVKRNPDVLFDEVGTCSITFLGFHCDRNTRRPRALLTLT